MSEKVEKLQSDLTLANNNFTTAWNEQLYWQRKIRTLEHELYIAKKEESNDNR